jgi:hypothetical protein
VTGSGQRVGQKFGVCGRAFFQWSLASAVLRATKHLRTLTQQPRKIIMLRPHSTESRTRHPLQVSLSLLAEEPPRSQYATHRIIVGRLDAGPIHQANIEGGCLSWSANMTAHVQLRRDKMDMLCVPCDCWASSSVSVTCICELVSGSVFDQQHRCIS